MISLFDTKIYISNCNLDTDNLYSKIKLFQSKTNSEYKSNQGGYQGHYFSDLDLENQIIHNIPQKESCPINNPSIHMWVNVNGKGDWNDIHNHSDDGVLMSGVFYVKCPEDSGCIRFYDPRCGLNKTYKKYYEEGQGEYIKTKPQENLMLLFPPWLNHMVEPNQSESERVSIAFNIIIQ